jgi:hypothetical protein
MYRMNISRVGNTEPDDYVFYAHARTYPDLEPGCEKDGRFMTNSRTSDPQIDSTRLPTRSAGSTRELSINAFLSEPEKQNLVHFRPLQCKGVANRRIWKLSPVCAAVVHDTGMVATVCRYGPIRHHPVALVVQVWLTVSCCAFTDRSSSL